MPVDVRTVGQHLIPVAVVVVVGLLSHSLCRARQTGVGAAVRARETRKKDATAAATASSPVRHRPEAVVNNRRQPGGVHARHARVLFRSSACVFAGIPLLSVFSSPTQLCDSRESASLRENQTQKYQPIELNTSNNKTKNTLTHTNQEKSHQKVPNHKFSVLGVETCEIKAANCYHCYLCEADLLEEPAGVNGRDRDRVRPSVKRPSKPQKSPADHWPRLDVKLIFLSCLLNLEELAKETKTRVPNRRCLCPRVCVCVPTAIETFREFVT